MSNKPVPSDSIEDLKLNVQIEDVVVTSREKEHTPDRLGVERLTLFGMEKRHDRLMAGQSQAFSSFMLSSEENYQRFLDSSGYSGWETQYAAGIVLNSHNQGFTRCEPDGTACMFYTPLGTTPLPYTTTGDWDSESVLFVARSADEALRQDLANPMKGDALVAAGGRTQKDKNSDIISVRDYVIGAVDGVTDNRLGIEDAIQECLSSGAFLYWPAGTYVSGESIANFHSVQHFGPGVLLRNGSIWKINPQEWDTQNLYVSSSPAAGNDGLSPSYPLAVSEINKALVNAGPVLNGDWRVFFSAGVYLNAVLDLPNVTMAGRRLLKFIGPPVEKRESPLVLFDGNNTTTIGVRARGPHRVEIRDISLFRYKDYGFSGGSHGLWFLNNVHTRDCRIGIAGENVGLLYVSSGIHDLSEDFETSSVENHRIMSRFVVKHAIGYSYDEDTGNPVIDPPQHIPVLRGKNKEGGSRGILAQELATGHINADVQQFAYGVDVRVSSRVHADASCIIKANAYGLRTSYGCNSQIQPAIDFGVGTADENTLENIVFQGGIDGNYSQPFSYSEQRVAVNKNAYTVTGTTDNTRIGGILYTLRARDFKNDGGLRLKIYGRVAGLTGRKTISLFSRGTTLISAVINASAQGDFVVELSSNVKSPGHQRGCSTFIIGGDTNNPGMSGGRIRETTLKFGSEEYPIEARVELQSASDSVTIEHMELWRLG